MTTGDLAWLAGTYRSDSFNPQGQWIARHEETWAEPSAGVVVGMYHNTTPEGLQVAEILTIEDEARGPVLRLRHFHPGLKPWASEIDGPITRPVSRAEPGMIEFTDPQADWPQTFRYIRTSAGLTIQLDGVRPDGAPATMEFRLDRVGGQPQVQ